MMFRRDFILLSSWPKWRNKTVTNFIRFTVMTYTFGVIINSSNLGLGSMGVSSRSWHPPPPHNSVYIVITNHSTEPFVLFCPNHDSWHSAYNGEQDSKFLGASVLFTNSSRWDTTRVSGTSFKRSILSLCNLNFSEFLHSGTHNDHVLVLRQQQPSYLRSV